MDYQKISNLITSWGTNNANAVDTKYPSAKLVHTALTALEVAISNIEDDLQITDATANDALTLAGEANTAASNAQSAANAAQTTANTAKSTADTNAANITKITNGTTKVPNATAADSATKATQDGDGNVIKNTYATKTAVQSAISNTHTHSNKTVLDNTTASYTTAEKTKLEQIDSSLLGVTADDIGKVKDVKVNGVSKLGTDGVVAITLEDLKSGYVSITTSDACWTTQAIGDTTYQAIKVVESDTTVGVFNSSGQQIITQVVRSSGYLYICVGTSKIACTLRKMGGNTVGGAMGNVPVFSGVLDIVDSTFTGAQTATIDGFDLSSVSGDGVKAEVLLYVSRTTTGWYVGSIAFNGGTPITVKQANNLATYYHNSTDVVGFLKGYYMKTRATIDNCIIVTEWISLQDGTKSKSYLPNV